MVSRATGMSLSRYLSEKVWKPVGMESDAFYVLDGSAEESTRPGPGRANVEDGTGYAYLWWTLDGSRAFTIPRAASAWH